MKSLPYLLCVALYLALFSMPAQAYIDPNAGGMLFQLLAPLFATLIGVWLFLRQWISGLLRRVWRLLTGRNAE